MLNPLLARDEHPEPARPARRRRRSNGHSQHVAELAASSAPATRDGVHRRWDRSDLSRRTSSATGAHVLNVRPSQAEREFSVRKSKLLLLAIVALFMTLSAGAFADDPAPATSASAAPAPLPPYFSGANAEG